MMYLIGVICLIMLMLTMLIIGVLLGWAITTVDENN